MDILKHYKAAPLSSSFFLASILGILITAFYWNNFGDSWSTAFILLFAVMFISSMISMRRAPIEEVLEADHHTKKKR